MWLKFYDEDGKLDFAINSNEISGMFTIKDIATWTHTTEIYLSNGNHINVNKPMEEIMEMIENGGK